MNYDDVYTPPSAYGADDAKLVRKFRTGQESTFHGPEAVLMSDTPEGHMLREDAALNYRPSRGVPVYEAEDPRKKLSFKAGKLVKEFAQQPSGYTALGRFINGGAVNGGIAGGAIGLTGGLLAGLIAKWLTGSGSALKWGLAGGLGGAALGALNGKLRLSGIENANLRKQFADGLRSAENYLSKSAAMFQDDRNVILEKLEAANDVSYSEKAKLAAAIRNLDPYRAKQLAELVRSALGFGVGAIIAKFLFGAGGTGALFGGIAGALGAIKLNSWAYQNTSFMDTPRKTTYADLLR